MIDAIYINGVCNFTQNANAEKCDFLQFLKRTSLIEPCGSEYECRNDVHLLSKLCAIGYLIVGYKDPQNPRAVFCESGIRNGKTLFANFFREVSQMYVVQGNTLDLKRDLFPWSQMPEETKIVLIDDVPEQFCFEYLFPNITGDWYVNKKGGRRGFLPFNKSPKLILTSEKPLPSRGASLEFRMWRLQFSDYYNQERNIVSDFGKIFYHEWNTTDWTYTWELIADCISLYLRYGYINTEKAYPNKN